MEIILFLIIYFGVMIYQSIRNAQGNRADRWNFNRRKEEQRIVALNEARLFLSPYKNIWQNLQLSNKYCTLRLGHQGIVITCTEKVAPYRRLVIKESLLYEFDQAWNILCRRFSHNTTYYDIAVMCEMIRLPYVETITSTYSQSNENKDLQPQTEKIDINNCSEIELTELPGISIVLAKKIIKKREEIGGFSSLDEFFNFLNLKRHFIAQIQDKIKIEKMRGGITRKYDNERTLDI